MKNEVGWALPTMMIIWLCSYDRLQRFAYAGLHV